MVDSIVFHLGDPKTGSTSIQDSLATRNLRAEGVRLVYTAPINHLPLATCLYVAAEQPEADARYRGLARDLARAGDGIGIVSAELFARVRPEDLDAMLRRHLPRLAGDARLIAYVRPHAERLLAAYAERLKQGFARRDLATLHRRTKARGEFFYAPRFEAWRRVFGARLTLRPFVRARLKGGDVVADFADFVVEGRPFHMIEPAARNESLSLQDLAMLRAFHDRFADASYAVPAARTVAWEFAEYLAGQPHPAPLRPVLDPALMADIRATYRADAAAMDRAFFDGAPLSEALEATAARVAAAGHAAAPPLAEALDPEDRRRVAAFLDLLAPMIAEAPHEIRETLRARARDRRADRAAALDRLAAAGVRVASCTAAPPASAGSALSDPGEPARLRAPAPADPAAGGGLRAERTQRRQHRPAGSARLIIHIGDPKTGSSAIQEALFRRSWNSDAATLAYPRALNQIPLAHVLAPDAAPGQRDRRFGRIARWLARQTTDVAVLSAEQFAGVDPRALRDALATHMPGQIAQCRIVAYVRPHADRLMSSFNQRVKVGGVDGELGSFLAQSLRRARFAYAARFGAWADVFGDRLVLRPMIRERLRDGDVVADFLHTVLEGAPFTLAERGRVNRSISARDLACLRLVQRVLGAEEVPPKTRHAVGSALAELLAGAPLADDPPLLMARADYDRLRQAFRPDAEATDARFFTDRPLTEALDGFAERSVAAPVPLAPEAHFAPPLLARLHGLAADLAGQFRRDSGAWQQAFTRNRRNFAIRAPGAHQQGGAIGAINATLQAIVAAMRGAEAGAAVQLTAERQA